jgi:S1-C subfamily serine protease
MERPTGLSGCTLLAAAAICGLLGGFGGAFVYLRARPQPAAPLLSGGPTAPATPATRLQVTTDSNAIVQAVQRIGPSVVKVIASQQPQDPLSYLLGSGPQVAIGSGFIITYQGRQLVLTNTHVVGEADQLAIKLTDGRQLQGRVLGAEPTSDIAAVEIVDPPADLVSATLGDSEQLQVGEWVIAVGNPFDYEHTVTVGVVSAKGYRPVSRNRYQNVIQTDAAINTGNSGGPLVDQGGNVVGINYRIYSPTGATVGIGFAIPIAAAKQMLYFLTEGGPWIGIGEPAPNSQGLARYLGLATDQGVVITEPAPNGPAQRAGLRSMDVILAVDEVEVIGTDQLRDRLLKHRIGDTINLRVQRGTEIMNLTVQAGRHPAYRTR